MISQKGETIVDTQEPAYPEALRKAKVFVQSILVECQGREPNDIAETVTRVAERVVKAVPSRAQTKVPARGMISQEEPI